MKILIIDDNRRLVEKIKQHLQKWYIVETAHSGDEGLSMLKDDTIDLIMLDLGLPDSPGHEVCRRIRNLSHDIPILVVTGIDTTESRVNLLETGADDYIVKPFEFPELHARIHALLRRRKRTEDLSFIKVGDMVIDPHKRVVHRNSTPISLRRKEFDILEYLARNEGRVMTRQLIVDHAWNSTSSGWVGSVDVHIKQLRDKVDKPFSYPLIQTAYGIGYMVQASQQSKEK